MSESRHSPSTQLVVDRPLTAGSRREFLRMLGVGSAIVLMPTMFAACSDATGTSGGTNTAVTLDLSTDFGVLNYAYALEQLEAAFYEEALKHIISGCTQAELHALLQIGQHEITHREFLKAALGSNAIPTLKVDFSSLDLTRRDVVFQTAKMFEDTGVAAYNGAGKLIHTPAYLVLAGKIVSVEARHAATIRDILNPKSMDFAGDDVVDANGLDQAFAPAMVLPLVAPFIVTPISA
ncbi:MAG: ferritin-like domain-containing protein [Gemmatimonadaceae bacterium]|nr:ferritin-like domain-containing protein [Gemmatimonadaceae bacterium]